MACGRLFGGRIKQGFVFHLCSDLSGDALTLYLFTTSCRRVGSRARSRAGGHRGHGVTRGGSCCPGLPWAASCSAVGLGCSWGGEMGRAAATPAWQGRVQRGAWWGRPLATRWHRARRHPPPRCAPCSPVHRDPARHDGPGRRGRGDGVLLPRQWLPVLLP